MKIRIWVEWMGDAAGGAGSLTHDMKSLVCFCALTLWGTPLMLLVCLAYYLSPWPSKQGNRQLWNIDVTLVGIRLEAVMQLSSRKKEMEIKGISRFQSRVGAGRHPIQ